MASRTTEIVYGVSGQTLLHRVTRGRPSAASFKVFSATAGDDSTAEFSGSATVDSPNTTVDAASGPAQSDAQRINLTSTASIAVGRLYLLSEEGVSEWVEPIEIVTNDYIRVRHPLQNNYAIGATFVSTYLSVAIDNTWVATSSKLKSEPMPGPDWRVRLLVTVASADVAEYAYFDLVRAPSRHRVTIEDLNVTWPGLVDALPTEYRVDQGRALLDRAERVCRSRLHANGLSQSAIRDDEGLDEYIIHVARRLLAEGGKAPGGFDPVQFLTIAQEAEERHWEQHFGVTLKHAVSAGTGGDAAGPTALPAMPFWAK